MLGAAYPSVGSHKRSPSQLRQSCQNLLEISTNSSRAQQLDLIGPAPAPNMTKHDWGCHVSVSKFTRVQHRNQHRYRYLVSFVLRGPSPAQLEYATHSLSEARICLPKHGTRRQADANSCPYCKSRNCVTTSQEPN